MEEQLLFSVAKLSDEEVANALGIPYDAPADAPAANTGTKRAQAQPHEVYLGSPDDQLDLFDNLPEYSLLPTEWQNKTLRNWDNDERYIPIEIAISAVFTIGNNKEPRVSFTRESIPILDKNYDLYYTGIELRQADELIWLQLLHLNRGQQPLGLPLMFKPARFLEELNLTPGAENYRHLKESMHRLQATTIELYSKRLKKSKTFRLVCHFDFEDENHYPLPHWKVVLDPRLFYLLQNRYHARMSFRRKKLLGSGLASKLHSYFACHRRPIDREIDDYFRLCIGNDSLLSRRYMDQRRLKRSSAESKTLADKYVKQRHRSFRRDLEQALQRLCGPDVNFLKSYQFYKKNGIVFVSVERNNIDDLPGQAQFNLNDEAILADSVY